MNNEELREIYKSWSTEDLLRAINVDRDDYLPEALEIMEQELQERDIPLEQKDEIVREVKQERAIKSQQLTGIKGWLLFFLCWILLGSIAGLISNLDLLNKPNLTRDPFILVIFIIPPLLFNFFGLYVFLVMVLKKIFAPKHATIWLISGFLYNLVVWLYLFLTLKLMAVPPMIFASYIPWLIYLDKSRRIVLTFNKGNQT